MDTQCTILFEADSIEKLENTIYETQNSFKWHMNQLDDSYFFNFEDTLFAASRFQHWEFLEAETDSLTEEYKERMRVYKIVNEDDEVRFVSVFYRQEPKI